MTFYSQLISILFLLLSIEPAGAQSRGTLLRKGEPLTIEAYESHKMNSYSTFMIDPSRIPDIVKHSDGRVEIVYPDGRSLTLGKTVTLRRDMKIPGKISEITCLPLNLRTRCSAKTDIMMKDYRVIWSSHPKQEQIGKAATFITPDSSEVAEAPLTTTIFATYEAQLRLYNNVPLVTNDEWLQIEPSHIECESYDWYDQLVESYSSQPKGVNLRLNEWSQEQMRQNPETLLSENRTDTAYLGVDLVKSQEGIKIENIDFMGAGLNSSTFLFFADVIGWNIAHNSNTCDLAFNFDSASFISEIQKTQAKIEKEIFKTVHLENEGEFEAITNSNSFHLSNIENNIGLNTGLKNLALLGFINSNFSQKEVLVDVIMVDGSLAKLPLTVYEVKIKEPVE